MVTPYGGESSMQLKQAQVYICVYKRKLDNSIINRMVIANKSFLLSLKHDNLAALDYSRAYMYTPTYCSGAFYVRSGPFSRKDLDRYPASCFPNTCMPLVLGLL